jgi:hypothetical protein
VFPVQWEIEAPLPVDMIAHVNATPSGLYQFTYLGVNYIGYILKISAKISGRGTNKITILANASTGFSTLIR